MKRKTNQAARPIDLGKASQHTLGGPGTMIDFVRFIEASGISRD